MTSPTNWKRETRLTHLDELVPNSDADVTPPITVSTTFKVVEGSTNTYSYSRTTQPNRSKCEKIIGDLEGGHAVMYSSGVAAVFSIFAYVSPKRVLIGKGGYFICQLIVDKFTKMTGMKRLPLEDEIQPGDLVWIETPKNPDCEITDIVDFVTRAHRVGAFVGVDATFAPPPVQQSLKLGADFVMHSTTKYFGGHSDLLGGVVIVKDESVAVALANERSVMGNVPGNLEVWLLLRSLRTYTLRVKQQCETAYQLAQWLASPENNHVIYKVWYPGLPSHPGHEIAKKQMNSFGAMLSIELKDPIQAQKLPQKFKLFKDATSLGGVESLVDWRYRWDQAVSNRLIRVSIGLEALEDLKADFTQAFNASFSKL